MVFDDDAEAPGSPGFEPREFPQPGHPMAATANATGSQHPPEFQCAVPFARLLMQVPQDWEELLILCGPRTHRAIPPGIVAATTYGEGPAQATDAMSLCLSPDKRVSHVDSLAKNTAAFFKMSRSSVTRANSRLSRASSAAGSACRPEPGNAPPCVATSFCHL